MVKTKKKLNVLERIFGGLNITWPRLIVFGIIMGVYTALMAMLVPDGNSFHDIAVTPEWWVLPAVLIMVNCKKPLESALKVFVFFLISQPIVYLVQVPFNDLGWGLFGYYKYWFIITLFTFPAAYIGWYIKKDKWYSGVILSFATVFLVITGFLYAAGLPDYFPNHLLSIIYCFGIIPVFIFGIFKDKIPRIITAVASVIALIVMIVIGRVHTPFETYNNTFLTENNITLVGEPYISFYAGEGPGDIEIIKYDSGYSFKLIGDRGRKYEFAITDDSGNEYKFEYYFDNELQSVVVKYHGLEKTGP